MSIDAIRWAWKIQNVTPTEKLILLSFADRAGESHESWPSWKRLELDTCISRKTIHKSLKSLQSKGLMIKTGDKKGQVFIYRLVGVEGREEKKLSTTSSKITTSSNKGTSSKITTGTSSKITTTTSSKITTRNHNKNPKRNPKGKDVFLSTENLVENRFEVADVTPSQDLISQVLFYVKTKPPGEDDKWVNIAVSLVKQNRWNIPDGWEGITSKSIKEKEEKYFRDKDIQKIEDEKNAIRLKKEILERGIIANVVFTREQPQKPHEPSQAFLAERAKMRQSLGLER